MYKMYNNSQNYGWFMVFNATFNNISVISWRSVLLVDETRGPGENHRPENLITYLALSGFRIINNV
jgi:hypothetical protein